MEPSSSAESLMAENQSLKDRIRKLELQLSGKQHDLTLGREELFQELGREMSAASSDHDVAMIIFNAARKLIGWDSCFLGIYDPDSDVMTAITECDTVDGNIREFNDRYFQRTDPGTLTRYILRGNAVFGNREDVITDKLQPHFFGEEARQSQSLIYAPLKDHRKNIFGIVTIQSYSRDFYEADHLDLFVTLAEYCGEAIARSYAETQLRLNEERINFALSGTNVGVWDWNLQTDVLAFTTQFAELLGYTLAEIENIESFWEYSTHRDDMSQALKKLGDHIIGKSEIYEHRRRMRRKDGEVRWFLDRGKTVAFDLDGQPIRMTGTITDITDELENETHQKKLEDRLREAQKMESVGILAGGIAHDFNNLLLSIIGNLDLAMAKTADDEIRQLIEGAESGALQAADLTQQILAYAGKAKFKIEVFNLSELVHQMTKLLGVSISKKIKIVHSLDPQLPGVAGDLIQIRQVMMNLIKNASDAIGEDPGEIQVTTSSVRKLQSPSDPAFQTVRFQPGRFVCLEVSDTGCGMDQETRQRIFEPFFSTKETGKGLGLASAVGIVRSHQGFIEIESAVGKGTSFRVFLPHIHANQVSGGEVPRNDGVASNSSLEQLIGGKHYQEIETPKPDDPIHEQLQQAGKALVIDDEPGIRKIACKMLEYHGLETDQAENGRLGLEVLKKNPGQYSLILLDYIMPEMDGMEVYKAIRETGSIIPILFSSGYNGQESSSFIENDPHVGFIQKPYRRKQLIAQISGLLQ